jgi:hypothetical protein
VWRVLIQLPSLISECVGLLRTINFLLQQSLLLQQETNLLTRELIVKVTTQPAETPPAVTLDPQQAPTPAPTPLPFGRARQAADAKPRRVLTEHDISHQTRSTAAQEQFRQDALKQFPHRKGEQLPSSPQQTATRPLGGPPV